MQLADGVYLHVPDAIYFDQERLGSTDFVTLSGPCAEDFWFGSRYNKARKPKLKSESALMGSGLHAYVLEGPAVFMERFERSPFETYVEAGVKTWKAGVAARNKTPLTQESWNAVFMMGKMIRDHKQMKAFFESGMSEVVVLFHLKRDPMDPDEVGIPCRAKFDKLLFEFCCDLKSYGGHKSGFDDKETCCDIVVQMKYDVQRYVYDMARHALRSLVQAGKVYAFDGDEMGLPTPSENSYLSRLARHETWQWVWVFYKVSSNSTKKPSAPILTPMIRDPQDDTWVRGELRTWLAVERYLFLVKKWGLDRPWARINDAINPSDYEFQTRYDYYRNRVPEPPKEEEDDDDDLDKD